MRFRNPFVFADKATTRPIASTVPKINGTEHATTYPDDLTTSKGLQIYRTMQTRDDMVSSAIHYLIMSCLSSGWQIDAASDEEQDIKARDYIEHAIKGIEGTPLQVLTNIMDCLPMGFSICEKVWAEPENSGDWVGYQGYRRIAHKNPLSITFEQDAYGEVTENGILQTDAKGNITRHLLDDVVYWPFMLKDDDPYGTRLLRPAYRYYFVKDMSIKKWASFIERYGLPLLMAKHDPDMSDEDVNTLVGWLKMLTNGVVSAFRDDIEITEYKPALTKETGLFKDAIAHCNRGIARSILLPALVGENSETGSYSLGKEHTDLFIIVLNNIRDGLIDIVNEQIVKPLHVQNFPEGQVAPKFSLKPLTGEDLGVKAAMVKTLVESGKSFDEDIIDDWFSIPKNVEGAVKVGKSDPAPGPAIEDTAEERREFTAQAIDNAESNRGADVPEGFGNREEFAAVDEITRRFNPDAVNVEEEIDGEFVGQNLALILESTAMDLEDLALKQPGGRANR